MDKDFGVFPIITEITYRRVKNIGNYETETVEAKAFVEDGQPASAVFDYLRQWTLDRLNMLPADNIEQRW